jgi:hypothetical protein
MKTIMKLILATACISLLFACTKEEDPLNNSSQPNSSTVLKSQDANRSISSRYVWEGYFLEIYCGGVKIDELIGTVYSHVVWHYKNGVYIGQNEQFSGVLTSQKTGELFKVKDIFKFEGSTWTGGGHINLIGNKRSHYILKYKYNPADEVNPITFTDAKCFEND